MQWFGWLTKGHYEVTVLDRLIAFGEFAVAVVVCVLSWIVITTIKQKMRRKQQ